MKAMANVNGSITPLNEAKISILDRGFQYGDSIYEVVRTYQGVPFMQDEHLDRLENSARLAKMKISQSRQKLNEEIRKTIAAASPQTGEDVFVRYTISRGVGPLDLDPATATETAYVIIVKEIPAWREDFYSKGMKIAIPETLRNSPLALDPNIKSGNYLNNILAVEEAKAKGADDALMLSLEGKLTEASNSNIVFVKGNKIVTPLHEPKTSTGNLRGITRTMLQALCQKSEVEYAEVPLTPADIQTATECFVTSATREIMPVREILLQDGSCKKYGDGPGKITQSLQLAYKNHTLAYVKENKKNAWF